MKNRKYSKVTLNDQFADALFIYLFKHGNGQSVWSSVDMITWQD